MIVIAIIGILAAVAIPQYQSYIARSEVQTSLGSTRAATMAIEDYINRFGRLPTAGIALSTTTTGKEDLDAYTGVDLALAQYTTFDKYDITYPDEANTITVTFDGSSSTLLTTASANTYILTVTLSGTPVEASWAVTGTLPVEYLPRLQ
jgi:type IV pilus assembly protein PilA